MGCQENRPRDTRVYLAEELEPTGETHPDADEFISVELRPVGEVIRDFGSPELSHAFMGTALAFYMRRRASALPKEGNEYEED